MCIMCIYYLLESCEFYISFAIEETYKEIKRFLELNNYWKTGKFVRNNILGGTLYLFCFPVVIVSLDE